MTCPSDVETDGLATILSIWPDSQSGNSSPPILAAPGSYKGVSGRRGPGGCRWFDYPQIVADQQPTITCENSKLDPVRGPLHMVVEDVARYPTVQATHIQDGLTNTLLVGEQHMTTYPDNDVLKQDTGFWAVTQDAFNLSTLQPESYTRGMPDYDACIGLAGDQQVCRRGFSSLHSGNVMNFVTCGGNVVRIMPNMDSQLFEAAGSIAGENEPIVLLE